MNRLRIFVKYISYKLTARHRKGHGIHSPFVFRLISEVVAHNPDSARLREVSLWHHTLLKNRHMISTNTFGAGSHLGENQARQVSLMARKSSVSSKYGRLLYRLAEFFKPGEIVELGTGLGVSGAYLKAGAPQSILTTVEGDAARSAFVATGFLKIRYPDVRVVNQTFDDFLADFEPGSLPLMIFIDGDHSFEATMRYYKRLTAHIQHGTILIIDDIHWSGDMERAWEQIKKEKSSALTVDLFFMGLVFFREGIIPQDFIVNF